LIRRDWIPRGIPVFTGFFIAFALILGKILYFFNPFAHCFFSRKEV